MRTIIVNPLILIICLNALVFIKYKYEHHNIPYEIDIEKNISNFNAINLSSIGNGIKYIPLETNPDCYIQTIEKVEFSESFIFVNEVRRLLQFTKDGKFIRQIGTQGRGPGEYKGVGDFCIDEQKGEVYIIDAPQLLTYGFDGGFKSSSKLSFRPSQIIKKSRDYLFYHLWNVPDKSSLVKYSWILSDRKGLILQSIRNSIKRVNQPGIIIGDTPLYSFNNTVHFMEFACDTLHYFRENGKNPYAIFKFGNLKMEPDPLIIQSQKEEISKELFKKFWINSIHENNDFLFFKLNRGISDSALCALYKKNNSAITLVKDNFLLNDIDGGIPFWPKQILNDTMLIDFVDAFDLKKRIQMLQSETKTNKNKKVPMTLIDISKQLNETSNPVLVLVY